MKIKRNTLKYGFKFVFRNANFAEYKKLVCSPRSVLHTDNLAKFKLQQYLYLNIYIKKY